MSRSTPPERVPTLTEVLDQTTAASASSSINPAAPALFSDPQPAVAGPASAPTADADLAVAQAITADLQAHIDRVLDARLRAALEPVLQQIVSRVIEETRRELASTLRDGMARALAQQNARHRNQR